jgi:hypothetical protein
MDFLLTHNSICYLTYFYTIINYFSHHKSSTYEKKTSVTTQRFGYLYWTYHFLCLFGLMMNHRDMWHPEKYTTKTRATQVQLPEERKLRMTLLGFRQETGD